MLSRGTSRVDDLAAWKKRTAVCGLLLLFAAIWASRTTAPVLALYLVQTQDVPVLILASISALLIVFWRPQWPLPNRLPRNWALLCAGIAACALLAWGTYVVLGNFPLARDEHMVVFDMAVFNSGRLAMPLAPEWQPYGLALVPNFLLNSSQPIGLVSGYLPMNAALRLLFSKVADPVWFNPLLALLGGAALLDIARRTFGPDDRTCSVVLLVYALSAQMLVTAMTVFSMTAHMALNLVWLAAFLRGGKAGHTTAIVVGFIAVGLHQLVFHPAFVAPFLLWELQRRNWRLVLSYAVAYAAILLWWTYYPLMVAPLVARPGVRASDANLLTDKIIPLLLIRDPRTIGLMSLNLLRFVAWQNLALLPLVCAAVPLALRQWGLARSLLLGIVFWLIFVTMILPEQGRGWGYRYLSPYLGSFALLAGFGFRELEQRIGRRADGIVVLLSGLTLFLTIPLLLNAAHRFMLPHLAVERLIATQPTAVVVIDEERSLSTDGRFPDFAGDHVRNLPDLSNRPLRFADDDLDPDRMAALCRKGPVTLITRTDMQRVGFMLNAPQHSPKFEALAASAERKAPGCFRKAIIPR